MKHVPFFLRAQEENRVERTHGECISENKTLHHHELLEMIDGYEAERGTLAAPLFSFFGTRTT